jgi:hypothetical protein
MNAIVKLSRSLLLGALLAGALGFVTTGRAHAAACTNDIDCKANGSTCGSDVCDWNMGMTCQPAGGKKAGADGWCATDTDCKCFAQGARCTAPYCTFTKASDAPAGSGGTTGHGGSTGAGGSASGGTTGAAGSASGGSTGTGGSATTSSGGGCAVASSSSSAGLAGSLVGLALVVGRLVRRRRRA